MYFVLIQGNITHQSQNSHLILNLGKKSAKKISLQRQIENTSQGICFGNHMILGAFFKGDQKL